MTHVYLVNPLGAALRHYAERVAAVIRASGSEMTLISFDEPSATGRSAASWLIEYAGSLRALGRARKAEGGGKVVILWPVLGHLDRLLTEALLPRADVAIVVHDPTPLVRALGYSPLSRLLGRAGRHSSLIVHSTLAMAELQRQGIDTTHLPLPLVVGGPAVRRVSGGGPTVRVLGQWKADRLLRVMSDLAPAMPGVRFEVIGRGWPELDGWSTTNEFVAESELDRLIGTSDAILIPYGRFYQSDIAARAMESAVPVVGPRIPLEEMTGRDYPFLVDSPLDPAHWVRKITLALDYQRSSAHLLAELGEEAAANAATAWKAWAQG